MTAFILSLLLGVTAALLATKRAWGLVFMAGLLALGFLHVAMDPLFVTAHLVVDEGVQP